MKIPNFDEIFQGASLLVLAVTVFVAFRQLKAGTEQARASEIQAKASVKMAQLSFEQTALMRAQMHGAFRPVVTVTDGVYGANSATLTLTNMGTGPALSIIGVYRSGFKQSAGNLAPEKAIQFWFDNNLSLVSPPLSSSGIPSQSLGMKQAVPLRLEYESVTGAKCWTNIDFPLGHEGALEASVEHGMDLPALALNHQRAAV